MELAIVTTTYPSATQTFVMDHVQALVDRGHDVDVYAFQKGEPIHSVPDEHQPRRIRYIPLTGGKLEAFVRIIRWLGGCLINAQNPLPALNDDWPTENFPEFARLLNRLPYLERFVFPGTYSLVHCHFAPSGALLASLKPYIGNPTLITTLHGYDVFQEDQTWYTETFIDRCDRFLSHSKNLDDELTELGIPDSKINRQRYGINVDEFTPSNREETSDGINLLSVARLVEKKGLTYALDAVAMLPESLRENLTYRIAGDGPLRSSLEDQITDLELESTVELLGFQNREEIKKLYARADIFMLPSVIADNGDREGTPVSLLEAQASGLPVVATYHSGIPEIVIDGETGLLVDERKGEALSNALEWLMANPEERLKMGQSGREFILEHHDSSTLIDQLITLYRGLTRC